jgi:hypothetical protein
MQHVLEEIDVPKLGSIKATGWASNPKVSDSARQRLIASHVVIINAYPFHMIAA